MRALTLLVVGFAAFLPGQNGCATAVVHERADAQALELARQAIALGSVRGPGNQAAQVADLFKYAQWPAASRQTM